MKIHELDVVALTIPFPNAEIFDSSDGLQIGDQGTVIGVWREDAGYIVEFFRHGETVAITDVTLDQVRVVWQYTPTASEAVNA